MSELPPQPPRPESQKIILPHEFTDEGKRRFGGTSYHSYEDYDERAGAQAEREYAEGDKGAEPAPGGTPESQPALNEDEARSEVERAFDDGAEPEASEAETTKMDAVDEDDSEETTEMPKVEKGDEETPEERRERIMREIDEADAMKRPTRRMKTLERIAYTAQKSDDMDLAIEATKRLRHSKTRKKFNPYGLWVRNTQAHDNIMHKLSQKPSNDKDRLDIAGNIQRGHKRNAVIGTIIESAYTSSHEISSQAEEKTEKAKDKLEKSDEMFKKSNQKDRKDKNLIKSAQLEDEARTLTKEAEDQEKKAERLKKKGDEMVSERLHGWRSSKYRGEVLEHWAALRNDPEVLLSLKSLDHFFRRGRIKRRIKAARRREEAKIFS